MLLLGLVCLGLSGGALILGVLVAALLLRGKNRALSVVLVVLFGPGLCMLPAACLLAGYSAITGRELTSSGPATVVRTPVRETAIPEEAPALPDTPSDIALSPEEILRRGAQAMRGVTSAHIVFFQEDVGNYTASGEGVVALPDHAHFDKVSSYDEAPVETIVIGSTGHWVDETVSGGWNGGPVAPFASNPARWVELLQFSKDPALLGEERINGVDCYHLEFDVNLEPGWLGLFSGGGKGEAWVSKADFSLVKAVYDLQYEGARESATMLLTFELSELNEPVSIEAPR
ncbi:MAG TPA: hypothetical protein VMW58_12885 [Anaerolineae bacterium]|nr:hypothetical protein [Anaerolineae bacterium]